MRWSAAVLIAGCLAISGCTPSDRGGTAAAGGGRVEVGQPAPVYATVSLDVEGEVRFIETAETAETTECG